MNIRYRQGFTLIEVIVGLFLAAVLLMALLQLQNLIISQEEQTFAGYVSVETANRAVEQIVKEVRNSRNGATGAYTLEQTQDQSLIFYSDIDHDDQVERVRYFLDRASLRKGITNPTSYPVSYPHQNEQIFTIAEDVVNDDQPIFYYYNGDYPEDQSNNPLTQQLRLTQTRSIGIHIVINSNPKVLKNSYEVWSVAQIRTLKDNL